MVDSMNLLVSALIGGVGIFVSIAASRRYSPLGQSPGLGLYAVGHHSYLRGIRGPLRDLVEIRYRGDPVEQLNETVLLIGNAGSLDIDSFSGPVEVRLPDSIEKVEVRPLYTHPPGREGDASAQRDDEGSRLLTVDFPVLNAGDYMLVHILTIGEFNPKELSGTVQATGIGPRVDYEGEAEFSEDNGVWYRIGQAVGQLFWVGVAIIVAIAFAYALWNIWLVAPQYVPFVGSSFELSVLPLFAVVLLATLFAVYLGVSLFAFGRVLWNLFRPTTGKFDPPEIELRELWDQMLESEAPQTGVEGGN